MPTADEKKLFAESVKQVLEKFVGPEGVKGVFFFTGSLYRKAFEQNLRKMSGGSDLILVELSNRSSKRSGG